MRKIFLFFMIFILFSSPASAENNSDVFASESHKIIGGLYSLVAAVELNAKTNADVNSVVRFFERIPPGWQNEVKIQSDKKSIWVGIAIDQYSKARSYIRAHASELGIFDTPGGVAWLGNEFAWIKAADISKKKLKPVKFSAAEADGTIFFNAQDSDTWWAAYPNFNSSSIRKILEAHGTDDAPELHAPKVSEEPRTSIYDDVKPASVRVPDKMHMGTKKNSFDMSMEVGDVIFNPIPNVHH